MLGMNQRNITRKDTNAFVYVRIKQTVNNVYRTAQKLVF
jgi:hypothetical protein